MPRKGASKTFNIVAFTCSKTARNFRPKNARRYTNPVPRWPKMRAKIVSFCQLWNPPPLSANARFCARAQTALPNPARGVISQCDIAVQSASNIVASACPKTAPNFRRKNARRYTNPVQRWPKMRPKIFPFRELFSLSLVAFTCHKPVRNFVHETHAAIPIRCKGDPKCIPKPFHNEINFNVVRASDSSGRSTTA